MSQPLSARYHYSVAWNEEDRVFVARVAEWPSLAAHGRTMEVALAELRVAVSDCIIDVLREGKEPPQPQERS